ncbi:hypothetical protein [Microtetraspora malaysiensis]|uniref:hypothetical protein n=1 Tax=Microtetraspora malaysiensis TaxID=161358 RepID=UPI003D9491F9
MINLGANHGSIDPRGRLTKSPTISSCRAAGRARAWRRLTQAEQSVEELAGFRTLREVADTSTRGVRLPTPGAPAIGSCS